MLKAEVSVLQQHLVSACVCRPVDISMQDICPRLAQMRDTAIPVMATAVSAGDLPAGQPTISAIQSAVKVLGTKTRPKRLWILGSDGRRHCFLLKVGILPAVRAHFLTRTCTSCKYQCGRPDSSLSAHIAGYIAKS